MLAQKALAAQNPERKIVFYEKGKVKFKKETFYWFNLSQKIQFILSKLRKGFL